MTTLIKETWPIWVPWPLSARKPDPSGSHGHSQLGNLTHLGPIRTIGKETWPIWVPWLLSARKLYPSRSHGHSQQGKPYPSGSYGNSQKGNLTHLGPPWPRHSQQGNLTHLGPMATLSKVNLTHLGGHMGTHRKETLPIWVPHGHSQQGNLTHLGSIGTIGKETWPIWVPWDGNSQQKNQTHLGSLIGTATSVQFTWHNAHLMWWDRLSCVSHG